MSKTFEKVYQEQVRERHELQALKMSYAPHVIFKPKVYPDGNQWCALYGEDLMMGVCGFGDTPAKACADFDKNWSSQRLRAAAAALKETGDE